MSGVLCSAAGGHATCIGLALLQTLRGCSSTPRALWTALYAAYAACFARTLGYGLVWDDAVLPRFARGGAPLSQLLLAPQQAILDPVENARSGAVMRADSYRPLQSLSHVLDLRALDAAPAVMHLHNLLLGALNIALAHRVARRLGASRGAALFAAAVFALHPLVVEPIAYVSARGDLLATAFALLALAFALPDRDGPAKLPIGAICGSAACYFLSLLAKEAYALLPLIVAVAAVLDRDLRARIPVLAAHAAAAAAYVALRANAMGRDAAQLGPGPFGALLHAPAVVLQYVRSFVLPLDASIARQEEPALAAPGIALLLAGAVIAVLLARRMHAQPSPDPAARLGILALVWIVVLLAPSWVVVADTHVLSDRYFYLPLLGAALLCAAVYARLHCSCAARSRVDSCSRARSAGRRSRCSPRFATCPTSATTARSTRKPCWPRRAAPSRTINSVTSRRPSATGRKPRRCSRARSSSTRATCARTTTSASRCSSCTSPSKPRPCCAPRSRSLPV